MPMVSVSNSDEVSVWVNGPWEGKVCGELVLGMIGNGLTDLAAVC